MEAFNIAQRLVGLFIMGTGVGGFISYIWTIQKVIGEGKSFGFEVASVTIVSIIGSLILLYFGIVLLTGKEMKNPLLFLGWGKKNNE